MSSQDQDAAGVAFVVELAGLLRLEPKLTFEPDASLFDDWALDSLQAFEMIVIIESMAGADVPPPNLPNLFTVGDAYAYYCSLRSERSNRLG